MKIVVGFIDTPEGHAAIDAAVAEASLRGATVVVVSSLRGGSSETEEEHLAARDAYNQLLRQLADQGVSVESHQYVRGNSPAEDIVQAVEEHDAGLIIIGIRERSTTGKVLLGSNALDILHDSPVPVLCVKPAND